MFYGALVDVGCDMPASSRWVKTLLSPKPSNNLTNESCISLERLRGIPRIPLQPFYDNWLRNMNISEQHIAEVRTFVRLHAVTRSHSTCVYNRFANSSTSVITTAITC